MDFKNTLKNRTKKVLTPEREKELAWFIGFAEGDGSWSAAHRNAFVINQKDPKVLYRVKKVLGFGRVKQYANYFRYSVTDLPGTLEIIRICNGNLLLEKSKARFEKYLELFNERPKLRLPLEESEKIPLLDHKPELSLKNAWLAGFLDAEGCFHVYETKTGLIQARVTLVQKGEPEAMLHISKLLKGALFHEKAKDAYRCHISSVAGKDLVLNYLDRYPLYSAKSIDKKRFQRIHTRLTDGLDHSSPKARARLRRLIKELQIKRAKED